MTPSPTKKTIETWFAGSKIPNEYISSEEQLCMARGTHQTTATGDIGGTPAYTATYQINATPIPQTVSLVYTTRRQIQYTSASWVYPKAPRERKVIQVQISQISAKIWMRDQQEPVVTDIISYLQVERFNAIRLSSQQVQEQLLRLHLPG